MKYPQYEKLSRIRKYIQEVQGMRVLKAQKELWNMLEPILKNSSSTGCTFHELHLLYRHIITKRPAYVLELGAGISTVVMAYAAKQCCQSGHTTHLVAMEDHEGYYDDLCKTFPKSLLPFTDLVLSATEDVEVEDCIARRYIDKPEHPYGLVFIDGPEIPTQKEDPRYLDGDFLDVSKWNKDAYTAYLDCRIGTRDNLKKLLPHATITYDKLHKFSRIDVPAR